MRRVKPETRNLAVMLVMFLVLAAAVGFARQQGAVRILPPEPREADVARKSADNAFYKLRTARDLVSKVRVSPVTGQPRPSQASGRNSHQETQREGLVNEDLAVKEALERYGPAINTARKALEKPYYLCPDVPNVRENLAEDVDFRGLAHLLVMRGLERAREGDAQEAFADLLDAVRLGRLVASDGPLASFYVGHDMQVDALKYVPEAAKRATSRETLAGALAGLSEAVSTPQPVVLALEFGWRMLDNSVGLPRQADVPGTRRRRRHRDFVEECKFTWQVRRGQRFIIRYREHLLEMAALSYPAYRKWKENRPEMAGAAHPFCDITGELDSLQVFRASMEAWGAGVRLALAFELFRRDHRAYPSNLEALAEYLTPVPLDPFTEAPYVYRVEGDDYWLYSLGENGTDEGGKGGHDDDVVIHQPEPGVATTSSLMRQ
jgi:hypothetical protein